MANYYQLSVTASVPNKVTIKTGAGKLKGMFCSSVGATPRITVYDSDTQTATDTIVSILTPPGVENYPLAGDYGGLAFSHGLYCLCTGTFEMTLIYE
jgi:hypothetical protein